MANVKIDNLAKQIAEELATYSGEVVARINTSSERVGKMAVAQLKRTSPKDTGAYAKSWAMKTEPEVGQPHKRVVYVQAPEYRLAHLLEYGHAKTGGGRVEGKPHIRPAEEAVIEQFTAEVEEAIKSG